VPFSEGSKAMTSPSCARTIATRREPGPLSLVVVTIIGGVGEGVGVPPTVAVAVGVGDGVPEQSRNNIDTLLAGFMKVTARSCLASLLKSPTAIDQETSPNPK